MNGSRLRTATLVIAALLIGIGTGLATGLFEGSDSTAPTAPSVAGETEDEIPDEPGDKGERPDRDQLELPPAEDDPEGLDPGPSGPAPGTPDELAAARAARKYVEAINDRDGLGLCRAFESGAEEPHELLKAPEKRGSCAATFNASFGFEGNDGQPVWSSSEMTNELSAQVDGDLARVVATVFTKYADVREPTIEDDIIYLSNSTDRWLVLKPSATLYRAVGIADIPLEALRPPR